VGTRVALAIDVLRITRLPDAAAGPRLKVEGRLIGEWVSLLEAELERVSGAPGLELDLAAVDFANASGIRLLRAAAARGVRVVAASPFLAKLLGERDEEGKLQ
jgi:hypothetical protein